MLRTITRPTTLSLLEQLTPRLVSRARSFSQYALNPDTPTLAPDANVNRGRKRQGPPIDANLRKQILAVGESRKFIPQAAMSRYNAIVAYLSNALKDDDLHRALTLWQELEDHRKAYTDSDEFRLSGSPVVELHKLFVTNGLKLLRWSQDEEMERTARAYALQTAKYHSAEALAVLMVHYIKFNDPHTALGLYDDFIKTIGQINPLVDLEQDAEALPEASIPNDSTFDLALTDEDASPDGVEPGRLSVVLAAVTAHAMLDAFKPAFEVYNSARVFVSSFRKQYFLDYLANDPKLQKKASTYINNVGVASLVSRPISFTKHITNLGDVRTAAQLEGYYNRILYGLFGPQPYIAASPELLPTNPDFLAAMNESSWNALQTAFIRAERVDLAAKVWDDLARAEIRPGITMWTGLLDTHAIHRDSNQALQTWDMLLKEGLEPDHLSYRAMIQVLMDDGKQEEGLKWFKEYQEKLGRKGDERERTVYNTVIHGLLRKSSFNHASQLLEEMRTRGPQPDLFTYNTFLGYYGRRKDFKGLSATLQAMSSSEIQGDVVTFSTILSALLAVGRKDAPGTIMSLMRKQGIKPNVATYTAMIDAQMRENSEQNLSAAITILDRMEKEEGIKPNEVTYTAILAGLYRGEWISRSQANLIRDRLVQRMRAENVNFGVSTYHILIRAALDSADPDAHLDALGLLDEMERDQVPRVTTTWYVLLAGLMRRGEWVIANDVVKRMLNAGHSPSRKVERMMRKIKAECMSKQVLG